MAVALLVASAAGACSSQDEPGAAPAPSSASPSASASPSSSASSASPSSSPSASPSSTSASPSPSAVGPTPTPGPSVIPKIRRPGQPSRPSISAAPAPFASPVAYSDGLELSVDKVTPGVETGQGPGVFTGREFAVFTVTLRNDTDKAIDAQQVVVTSTYGSRDLVAERVYANDARAVDFGGRLAPGKSATARYAFAVPAKQLGDVRLVVDFDGLHTSAQFDGDARKAS